MSSWSPAPRISEGLARARQALRSLETARALAALPIALPPLFWVYTYAKIAQYWSLGRDQGIFQYIAWAALRGDKLYRDVRDVNGPLTAFVHMVFQLLGGAEEHRFRLLDLGTNGLVFFLVGFCLPGSTTAKVQASRATDIVTRTAWGLASGVVLGGQYLGVYNAWNTAQRESFADWFVLGALALQIAGQARRGRLLLGAAAALGAVSWFCKPTLVLLTLVQLLAVVVDDEMRLPLLVRLRTFAAGVAVGVAVPLALLVAFGDPIAYARILLVDIPRMYVFIWPNWQLDLFNIPWHGALLALSVATSTSIVALVGVGLLPRRALAIGLAPIVGLASVVVQRKGFDYHFHPVSVTSQLQLLVLCVHLADTFLRGDRAPAVRLIPFVATFALGLSAAQDALHSPNLKDIQLVRKFAEPAARTTDAYLAMFNNGSYDRVAITRAAEYLRQKVPREGRVFLYGMDAYLLFLGQRLAATPYIYNYDLNATAALAGGPDLKPTTAQAAWIEARRRANALDTAARLQARPPAALAFLDGLYWGPDGWLDFKKQCPEAAAFVDAHFKEAATFGKVRVWLPSVAITPTSPPAGPPGP